MKKVYPDDIIIKGCANNNRKYQEILYKKYYPDCYYMCLRYTKDPEKAQMIVHDGLLKVYMKLDKFNGEGNLRSWIKRIVFNCMSDYFRKESKYLKLFVFDEVEKSEEVNVLSNLYYDDLLTVLDQLDFVQREVFQLFAIEGYSHKEIGKQLSITESNSKWHLFQARKKLKELLNRNKIKRHA